ncbi:MAG: hypothetical protein BZ138_03535 [Methanosphaera sp. rholeuAM270]|nr:MAG: hypothetical protein BZ138_03535 [Methanosphaera sp. rholeuAM270]
MASPLEIILVPTLMIILGYLLKRYEILKSKDSIVFSKIVLDVTLPSLIFVNLTKATITGDMLALPIFSLMISAICIILAYLFCSFRGYSKVKTWTIVIACSMMNTGFLGFPITMGVFSNEGFLYAIFFDLGTTIIFVIFGILLVNFFGGNRMEILRQSITFVPLWAVVLALLFNIFNLDYGYVLENSLTYLGQATIPLIMITLGLRLDFNEMKSSISDSLFVAIVKLFVAPAVMFLVLTFIGFEGLGFQVSVLESGMATAMNALVLAINYDLDVKLMSSVIFFNTLLALLTLTFLIGFLI